MMSSLIKKLFIFSFLMICLACQNIDFTPAPGDKATNQVIKNVTKKLAKKYFLKISGIGGGEDEKGIWRITVYYDYRGPSLDLEKSRILMVNVVEAYLNEVNQDEQIRPYLKNYPFVFKNLDLAIITYQIDGKDYFDPDMDTISTINDRIKYSTRDADNHFKYKNSVIENYEEALKIVKENGQLEIFN